MGLRLGGLHHWAIIRRKYANFPSFNHCSLYILGLVEVAISNRVSRYDWPFVGRNLAWTKDTTTQSPVGISGSERRNLVPFPESLTIIKKIR